MGCAPGRRDFLRYADGGVWSGVMGIRVPAATSRGSLNLTGTSSKSAQPREGCLRGLGHLACRVF